MPVAGQGMVPSGASFNELSAVVNRSFIPKLVVQLYRSTPVLSLMMRNAQLAGGGMSQVAVPVQGSSLVNYSYTDYTGSYAQPPVINSVQTAEFNLSLGVCPVPMVGPEALVQDDSTIINLVEARMADAKTVIQNQVSRDLLVNDNTSNALAPFGLRQIYNTGTNFATYGNINRTAAGNSFWNGNIVTGAGAILTRAAMTNRIVQATALAGGESPDAIIMSMADWSTLAQDFIGQERYITQSNAFNEREGQNAGFTALSILNVPIFADPSCPVGTIYMLNSKYLAMYIHRNANFAFSGFQSTIPNLQFGYLGLILLAFQFVCTKPSSGLQITGVTGGGF